MAASLPNANGNHKSKTIVYYGDVCSMFLVGCLIKSGGEPLSRKIQPYPGIYPAITVAAYVISVWLLFTAIDEIVDGHAP